MFSLLNAVFLGQAGVNRQEPIVKKLSVLEFHFPFIT
jgi:hypothetical protein